MAAEGTGGREPRLERIGASLGAFLVFPTLAVLFAAAVYAIGDAVLAPTPVAKSPGFIDTVLASRSVVAAIRLAIIFAGVFVVISVVALIARRQWLTRVGPLQVSEQVSDIDAENQRLKESLENARETIDNLKQDLAETNYVLDQVMRDSGGAG
jgi:ABC-type multidrug transport system fused ATPase/permease subunit